MSQIKRYPFSPPLFRSWCPFSFAFFFGLPSLHGGIYENSGVVAHVLGGKSLTCNVGNPITELILTRRGEASLLAVKGVANQ